MNFSISNYWAILKLSHIELAIFKDVKDQKNRLKLCSKSSDKSHRNDCSAWYDHTPCQISKMELFAQIFKRLSEVNYFLKKLHLTRLKEF